MYKGNQLKMELEDMLKLAMVLFVIYYVFVKKEPFENEESNDKRGCSQKAINDAYQAYIFGSVPSTK